MNTATKRARVAMAPTPTPNTATATKAPGWTVTATPATKGPPEVEAGALLLVLRRLGHRWGLVPFEGREVLVVENGRPAQCERFSGILARLCELSPAVREAYALAGTPELAPVALAELEAGGWDRCWWTPGGRLVADKGAD